MSVSNLHATASTATKMAGRYPSEKDMSSENNASGFTAVNGRESLVNGTNGRTEAVRQAGNESIGCREQHVDDQSTSRQQSPRPGQDAPPREMQNGNHQYSSSHDLDSPASSPGKRKRSLTDDGRGSSGSSHYDLSPPRRATGSPTGLVDPRMHRAQEGERSHASYVNGSNGGDSHNIRGHDKPWPAERLAERQAVPSGYQSTGHHMDASDAQLAEALQRETQSQNSHRTWGIAGRPDDGAAEHYGAYGADRGSHGGAVQAGPKRKRVFSNRTKTGCMTCRKRKKKCDEGHPFCNNCMRGGFTCEGYSTRTTWQKQTNVKGPVPLQSKDGYEGSDHTYSAESHSPGAKRESAPYEGGHQMRPIVVDDTEQQTHYVTSPISADPRNRSSYSQPWGRNASYVPDQTRQDLPPFSEIAREPGKPPYGVPPIREYPRPHSTSQQSSGSWPAPSADYRQSYAAGPVDPHSLQGVAREGLSMEETQRNMMKGDELQKEKMLSGQLFKYNDPILVEDRKRCKIALKQFHDADNPTMGVAETERARKLKEVFAPTRNPLTNMPYTYKWDPMGAIGPGSVVETPFRCQYGYNIRIGEDVYIGENCTIIDSCSVIIGAKTWIGQNVQILTGMAHTGINMRAGSLSSWMGKAITIGEDVHIGAGAIIYPGVTIHRGAQIEPGAVVKKDVDTYFQSFSLSHMI